MVTLHDVGSAVPLAEALARGGLPVVEVTLRTPVALEAVRRIRDAFPDVLCGVGTVLSAADVDRAVAAGAQFLVSPGSSRQLLVAMRESGLPSLPGAFTVSEAMRVLEEGFDVAKFYPAALGGGVAALTALAGPLPTLRWCATGGITRDSAPDYLALPQVAAVGGSWMAPDQVVASRDWETVRDLVADTVRHLAGVPRLRPV